MNIEMLPASDEIKASFEKLQLLTKLIRRSELMISQAISRLERGNRLRTAAQDVAIDQAAYQLAISSRYQAEAYTHLSVLPWYLKNLRKETMKVHHEVKEALENE